MITHLLGRAVIMDGDHVLVVQAEGEFYTFLPGGHHEGDEGMAVCLRRELREELGLECRVGRYLGALEHAWNGGGKNHYEINHCFEVTAPDLRVGTPVASREPILTFRWARVDELRRLDLRPQPLCELIPALSRGDEATWWGSTLPAPR